MSLNQIKQEFLVSTPHTLLKTEDTSLYLSRLLVLIQQSHQRLYMHQRLKLSRSKNSDQRKEYLLSHMKETTSLLVVCIGQLLKISLRTSQNDFLIKNVFEKNKKSKSVCLSKYFNYKSFLMIIIIICSILWVFKNKIRSNNKHKVLHQPSQTWLENQKSKNQIWAAICTLHLLLHQWAEKQNR